MRSDPMDIARFMQGCKAAWEAQDETLFCALFAADGVYRNTPFAVQRGHAELAARFGGGLCTECRLWWHSLPVPE